MAAPVALKINVLFFVRRESSEEGGFSFSFVLHEGYIHLDVLNVNVSLLAGCDRERMFFHHHGSRQTSLVNFACFVDENLHFLQSLQWRSCSYWWRIR